MNVIIFKYLSYKKSTLFHDFLIKALFTLILTIQNCWSCNVQYNDIKLAFWKEHNFSFKYNKCSITYNFHSEHKKQNFYVSIWIKINIFSILLRSLPTWPLSKWKDSKKNQHREHEQLTGKSYFKKYSH